MDGMPPPPLFCHRYPGQPGKAGSVSSGAPSFPFHRARHYFARYACGARVECKSDFEGVFLDGGGGFGRAMMMGRDPWHDAITRVSLTIRSARRDRVTPQCAFLFST